MDRPFTSVVLTLLVVALAGYAEAGATLRSQHSPDAQTVSFEGRTVVAMIMHEEDIVRRSTKIMLAQMLIARG